MLDYTLILVFTRESARHDGKPVADAVVDHVRSLRTSARVLVTHADAGCYETGDVATTRIEALSYDLPVRIDIVVPAAEAEPLLAALEEIVTEGVVGASGLRVVSHKTRMSLLPRQVRVRDAMTADPRSVGPATPAEEVARLLLSAAFHAVPVVDDGHRPIGIIAQGDLIERTGLPLRLGLLEELSHPERSTALAALAGKTAAHAMSKPVVTVAADRPLTEAVRVMLDRDLKRLPVVDATGRLVGMLSRYDVFHTISAECPNWEAMRRQRVVVHAARAVKDVMNRDAQSVAEEMTVDEILRTLGSHDIQRVAVVDREGRFRGLISDRDLLRSFSEKRTGFWTHLAAVLSGRAPATVGEHVRKETAAQVMVRDVQVLREDAPLEEAVRLMTARRLKRIPVVDERGLFRGMISRDGLLRAAFGEKEGPGPSGPPPSKA